MDKLKRVEDMTYDISADLITSKRILKFVVMDYCKNRVRHCEKCYDCPMVDSKLCIDADYWITRDLDLLKGDYLKARDESIKVTDLEAERSYYKRKLNKIKNNSGTT